MFHLLPEDTETVEGVSVTSSSFSSKLAPCHTPISSHLLTPPPSLDSSVSLSICKFTIIICTDFMEPSV